MKTGNLRVSSRAADLPFHAIREVMELAWSRPGTIHLEVGEPGFPTPPHVIEAAADAARGGNTRYTPNGGVPKLREALSAKVERVNGYAADPEQVVVTNGGVEAIYSTLLALTDPGDQILMPDPAWPDFMQIAHLLGVAPQLYHQTRETSFLPDLDELERLIRPRTRVLVINSPSNPLGTVIPRELMVDLVAFAERHDLWVLSDECYDEISFDGTFSSAMEAAPSSRIVSIYSFSKVYAMTGWRVGYAVAPPAVAGTLTRLQEPIISCVNAPAQAAALGALTGPQDVVAEMRDAYRDRRDRALEVFEAAGVPALRPSGAFYLWVDAAATGTDCRQLARTLIEEDAVAVAPGSAFGKAGDGFVRICLASELEPLLEGTRRIAARIAP